MERISGENSRWSSNRLLLILTASIFCLGISVSYPLGILPLEGVFLCLVLPVILLLFLVRQETLLLAIVAAYFIVGYFFSDFLIQGLVRGSILFLVGFMLILQTGAKKNITRISTSLDRIIFLWVIIILISFLYGFYFEANNAKYLFGDLYKFVEIISIFWLTTLIVKNRRQVRSFIWGFFFIVLALGAVDFVSFFVRTGVVGDILEARIRAGVQFSSIFALILAAALVLHEKRIMIKLILAFLSLAFLVSFLLSFLRTGYVVIPSTFAIVLFLYFYKNKNRVFGGIKNIALLIFFLLLFVVSFNMILSSVNPRLNIIEATFSRLVSIVDPYSGDPMGVRTQEAESIVSYVLAGKPLLGSGLGGEYYSAGKIAGKIQWGMKHYVHNNYLDFLVRTGILGLFIFFVFAFKYLKDAITFYLRSRDDFYQGALLGCIGIFISSMMIAFSVSIFYCPFIFIVVAMTYCIAHFEEKNRLKAKKND